MTDYNPESASVLSAVRDAFDGVTMPTPLGALVAEAGTRRRRRRVIAASSLTAVVGIAALAIGTAGSRTTSRTLGDGHDRNQCAGRCTSSPLPTPSRANPTAPLR